MDTLQKIEAQIDMLKKLRITLEREIDSFSDEVDRVENEDLGVMNYIKAAAAKRVVTVSGTESVLGDAYAFKKNHDFKNAREYIDYLKLSAGHTRDAISKVDQAIGNLDKCQRDLSYQIKGATEWLQRSGELLK